MFGDRFSSSTTCSRWQHETEPGRLDQSLSRRFWRVATHPSKAQQVIVGVDTHKYVHVAVAIDTRGTRLGDHSFVANSWGYRALIRWANTHGRVEAFGVERRR